jgi:hypothetical protein
VTQLQRLQQPETSTVHQQPGDPCLALQPSQHRSNLLPGEDDGQAGRLLGTDDLANVADILMETSL